MIRKGLRYGMLQFRKAKYEVNKLFNGRWSISQKLYEKWTYTSLSENYLQSIILLGEKFADFIGTPVKTCLDIGCGNGLYSGKTYDEVGYNYIHRTEEDIVYGIDPLPLATVKPKYIDTFIQIDVEEFSRIFHGRFDTIISATSFDHFENPKLVLEAVKHLLKPNGKFFIWVSCFSNPNFFDPCHIRHYTVKEFMDMIMRNGFFIVRVLSGTFPKQPTVTTLFLQTSLEPINEVINEVFEK